MKKGDIRRDNILKVAEKLFMERGFAETSVQDILDALNLSKGGFYHYFDSKLSLLEAICQQHAERSLDRIEAEISAERLQPIRKLNLILSQVFLLNRDEPEMNALILKISYLDGDVQFREHMRSFMFSKLREMLENVLLSGMKDESMFVRKPQQISQLILMLAYDVNDEVCRMLTSEGGNPETVIEIIDLLDAGRDAIETLTGAGYGTVQLFDLEQLLTAFRQTSIELERIREKNV